MNHKKTTLDMCNEILSPREQDAISAAAEIMDRDPQDRYGDAERERKRAGYGGFRN